MLEGSWNDSKNTASIYDGIITMNSDDNEEHTLRAVFRAYIGTGNSDREGDHNKCLSSPCDPFKASYDIRRIGAD